MKKIWIILMVLAVSLLSFSENLSNTKENITLEDKDYKIIAYLPCWVGKDWTAEDIQGDKLTHLYLAFARINNEFKISNHDVRIPGVPDTVSSQTIIDSIWEEVRRVQKKYPDLKIIVAVGGWGADGFSDMAATKATREIFVDSVVEYLKKYNLDGIDIDWEYPVDGGGGTIEARKEDKENFTEVIKLLREKLGEDKEISFCTNVSGWFLDVIEWEEVVPLVNSINVMGYDYQGPWSENTAHHSNLYINPQDPVAHWGLSSDAAIKRFINRGIPAEKLVLGFPAYGREFHGAQPGENGDGLFQKYQDTIWPGGSIPYTILKQYYVNKNNFKRFWDDDAKVPYLYDGETFITYEDPQSVAEKARYVKEMDLGGIMYWEYVDDIENDLLNSAYETLKK
ncbi:MAG: glycoside hydrolase family 18 protein [Defluviitoga tunisiensis]|jgi:chitinase|nr:glycoside hydrolase family 18 protein [Defluviitoga tunisiensis]HOB55459.1 glycoside hydrolase family 18 protein [Defluviitoga tunisiensis]HPZ66588.1 glycoside hydrolase family 18 protein [Defluviitoga tunisiensis]